MPEAFDPARNAKAWTFKRAYVATASALRTVALKELVPLSEQIFRVDKWNVHRGYAAKRLGIGSKQA